MIDTAGNAPIVASDRVSDVLARDESLVDVFERHAPHFSKLRNRSIRRVMARLVTVEQAARTAHVAVEQLVAELDRALRIGLPPSVAPSADAMPLVSSGSGEHPAAATVVELDVRDDLRSGREPFSRIMGSIAALRDDEVLHLRALFEPVPLFAVLAKRGFSHESRANAPDDWSVWFWRAEASRAPEGETRAGTPSDAPVDDATTPYLDVRGLAPPEPMTRTLFALETLRRGHTLVQINNRVPQLLLPMLAERGFACEVDESRADRVIVRIWRIC